MMLRQIFVLGLLVAVPAPANDNLSGSEGHGGDGIKLLFAKAKQQAQSLLKDEGFFERLADHASQEVETWIRYHYQDYIDDIDSTPQHWSPDDTDRSMCALTEGFRYAPIRFALDACKASTPNLLVATEIILHESVHHFGVADEEFADQIAIAIGATSTNRELEKSGVWAPLAPDNHPCKQGHQQITKKMVALGNHGVLVLGTNYRDLNFCGGIYSFSTGTWNTISQPVLDPDTHVIVKELYYDRGKVFLTGSLTSTQDNSWLDFFYSEYDINSNTWKNFTIENHPSARFINVHYEQDKERVYVFNYGFPPGGEMFSSAGYFDFMKKTWTAIPLPDFLKDVAPVSLNKLGDLVFVYGARIVSSTEIWSGGGVYDLKNATWKYVPAPSDIPPNHIHGGVALKNRVYFFLNEADRGFVSFHPESNQWQNHSAAPEKIGGLEGMINGQLQVNGRFYFYDVDSYEKPLGLAYDPKTDEWSYTTVDDGFFAPLIPQANGVAIDNGLFFYDTDYVGEVSDARIFYPIVK